MDSATSPVPGGMSTTRKSGAPQSTSTKNCASALWSIGPRHMTGWSSGTKKPMDITLNPKAVRGLTPPSPVTGSPERPSIAGTENP